MTEIAQPLAAIFAGLVQGVRKGQVVEVGVNGSIQVADATANETISCVFLRTSVAPPPVVGTGDIVLYVKPDNDQDAGYVLGLVESPLAQAQCAEVATSEPDKPPTITQIKDDVVHIKANKGLVIECGQGTLIITEDGRIQIKGNEVLSRAKGLNRIRGAAVSIN